MDAGHVPDRLQKPRGGACAIARAARHSCRALFSRPQALIPAPEIGAPIVPQRWSATDVVHTLQSCAPAPLIRLDLEYVLFGSDCGHRRSILCELHAANGRRGHVVRE